MGAGGRLRCALAALLLAGVALSGCADEPPPRATSSPPVSPSVTEPPSASPPSVSSSSAPPPYIASTMWRDLDSGRSLAVVPTPSGRRTQGVDDGERAWAEVLGLQPDAATPGMKEQFLCHWVYARLVDPDKPSWNLEPWRPVVSDDEMVRTRCNPGGAEETDPAG